MRALVMLVVLLASLGITSVVRAETRVYVLAIGNNQPPTYESGGEELPVLRFADDDAAAFFAFTRTLSHTAELLTVLDSSSQARFPDLAPLAKAPSLAELRRVVSHWRVRIDEDRKLGHDPVVLFFFSGHGARGADQPASLVLSDAPLTQQILYDEVLAALPARYVHLLVDACYAESIVRPRDAQAATVELSAKDLHGLAARSTLARFPNVGAIVAATTTARAFEWDALERGVFTHAVLSGLRGAADVNKDRRIEYSELYAFLSASNRDVSDPRARLSVVARPPALDARAAIVELAKARAHATLVGTPPPGRFSVEDAIGNRLLDANVERGATVAISVPAGRLYLRENDREASRIVQEGERVDFARFAFASTSSRSRGSIESSIQRGLFAAPYGPQYYRAFIEGREGFVPVTFSMSAAELSPTAPAPSRTAAWATLGTSAALAVATSVLVGLTLSAKSDWEETSFERSATEARDRFVTYRAASVVGGALTALTAGAGLWLLLRKDDAPAPARTAASVSW